MHNYALSAVFECEFLLCRAWRWKKRAKEQHEMMIQACLSPSVSLRLSLSPSLSVSLCVRLSPSPRPSPFLSLSLFLPVSVFLCLRFASLCLSLFPSPSPSPESAPLLCSEGSLSTTSSGRLKRTRTDADTGPQHPFFCLFRVSCATLYDAALLRNERSVPDEHTAKDIVQFTTALL